MKNLHSPESWKYEVDNISYIKVGAYGIDDLEYVIQSDGSVFLPEVEKYYTSLENAYTYENKIWMEQNDI